MGDNMLLDIKDGIPQELTSDQALWVYNALDCAVTLEVWRELQAQRTPAANTSYGFVSAMRAPALAMMNRGIRVDMGARAEVMEGYRKKIARMDEILQRFTNAVWDRDLNPRSSQQVQAFFYGAMKIPAVRSFKKGEVKYSADRDTLEKLETYFHARPIVKAILASRDYAKKLEVLEKSLDQDNRFRYSFNVVGTETGRWSSSEDAFGRGDNIQNKTDEIRRIFISDDGMKLGEPDLEQAESRVVAYRSDDKNYILACESGDPHTTVAKLVWPNLSWSKDDAENRILAETPFYRHFSYRDMAKRGGHATNYYGKPPTVAKNLHVPASVIESFQDAYFSAFPGIRKWHHKVAEAVQVRGYLTTALGRERHFLGRRFDDSTLREAIAFEPQSIVGEVTALWIWKIWKYAKAVQPLANIHDAILLQFPKELEVESISTILNLSNIPISFPAGNLIIPADMKTGWNWGKYKDDNKDGLKKWKGSDDRGEPKRARGLLDRPISSIL